MVLAFTRSLPARVSPERRASQPDGEITLGLVQRLAALENVTGQDDWAKWYLTRYGKEPSYSEILDALASTAAERGSDDGVIAGDDCRLEAGVTHGVLDQPVEIRCDHDPHCVRGRQLRDRVMGFRRLANVLPLRRIDKALKNGPTIP
jgi:hypothetical protein